MTDTTPTTVSATAARGRLDLSTAAAVAVTVLAWSSAFPAIRAGLGAFGPLELGAARFAIAALPAALFLAVTRAKLPRAGEAWRFLAGGLLFVALYTAFLNMGEQTVSAGAASFIINVNPILTAAASVLLLGERFGPRAWLGTALSFAGIGLIALGDLDATTLDVGALYILGSALCTTLTTLIQKPLFAPTAARPGHNPLVVSAWNMAIGAAFLSPWMPAAAGAAMAAPADVLLAVVYLGLVPSFVAYGSWAVALSRLPAARASNFMYCVPPTATLMGWLWLGEVPGALGLAGGALALGGVVLVNLRPRGSRA